MRIAVNSLFIFLFCVASYGEELTGKVVGVKDGDTVVVLSAEKQQVVVRLSGIDAPEKAQAFGSKAKQALSDLVYGQEVTVRVAGVDRYGRTLGEVLIGGKSANLQMVEWGYAWHYRQYSSDPVLQQAEDRAKAQGSGLWAEKGPVPPWAFRRVKSGKGPVRAGVTSGAADPEEESSEVVQAPVTGAVGEPSVSGGESGAGSDVVYVKGYQRADGTYVRGHFRARKASK